MISSTLYVSATENSNLILALTKCDAWKEHSSASCEQLGEKCGPSIAQSELIGESVEQE